MRKTVKRPSMTLEEAESSKGNSLTNSNARTAYSPKLPNQHERGLVAPDTVCLSSSSHLPLSRYAAWRLPSLTITVF
jgi:hypothetical protein